MKMTAGIKNNVLTNKRKVAKRKIAGVNQAKLCLWKENQKKRITCS